MKSERCNAAYTMRIWCYHFRHVIQCEYLSGKRRLRIDLKPKFCGLSFSKLLVAVW